MEASGGAVTAQRQDRPMGHMPKRQCLEVPWDPCAGDESSESLVIGTSRRGLQEGLGSDVGSSVLYPKGKRAELAPRLCLAPVPSAGTRQRPSPAAGALLLGFPRRELRKPLFIPDPVHGTRTRFPRGFCKTVVAGRMERFEMTVQD